jgi:hypothetical protein
VILIVCYTARSAAGGHALGRITEALKGAVPYSTGATRVWLLEGSDSPDVVRDRLVSVAHKDDEVFVARLERHLAATNVEEGVVRWLRSSRREW